MRIFEEDGDDAAFERVLAEAVERRPDARLVGYCLMPNHWHLVLWPRGDDDLSEFMRWLTRHPHTTLACPSGKKKGVGSRESFCGDLGLRASDLLIASSIRGARPREDSDDDDDVFFPPFAPRTAPRIRPPKGTGRANARPEHRAKPGQAAGIYRRPGGNASSERRF